MAFRRRRVLTRPVLTSGACALGSTRGACWRRHGEPGCCCSLPSCLCGASQNAASMRLHRRATLHSAFAARAHPRGCCGGWAQGGLGREEGGARPRVARVGSASRPSPLASRTFACRLSPLASLRPRYSPRSSRLRCRSFSRRASASSAPTSTMLSTSCATTSLAPVPSSALTTLTPLV